MDFYGFQKMTLLDFPGKVACTLFTGGCNLRCPFCHNALLVTELDRDSVFPEKEILSYLEKRVGLLDGVCITGGEPLMNTGLPDFIRKVKALGYAVKLDTNGCYPDRLTALVEEGLLDYVAMDVKNAPARYAETVGLPDFSIEPIRQSISFLLKGKVDFEFRTTVTREFHTVAEFEAIGRLIEGAPRYFLQAFVDSGSLIGENLHAVEKDDMLAMLETVRPFVKQASLRGI